MSALAQANIEMKRGNTRKIDLAIADSGVPVNLTGVSLTFEAKYSVADTTAFITKDGAHGITVTDAAGGKCTIQLDPADTSSLPSIVTVLYWDVRLTDATLKESYTVAEGKLVIEPEIVPAS